MSKQSHRLPIDLCAEPELNLRLISITTLVNTPTDYGLIRSQSCGFVTHFLCTKFQICCCRRPLSAIQPLPLSAHTHCHYQSVHELMGLHSIDFIRKRGRGPPTNGISANVNTPPYLNRITPPCLNLSPPSRTFTPIIVSPAHRLYSFPRILAQTHLTIVIALD